MPLDLGETRRFARQIALPEIGAGGMARVRAATAVIIDDDLAPGSAASTAATYLEAGGVGQVRRLPAAVDLAGWRRAMPGANDVVMRFGLDDDGLLTAAEEAGVALLVGRAPGDTVELLVFRRQRACGHPSPAPTASAAAAPLAIAGAAGVVLGTLAASEALLLLAGVRADAPAAALLRLPLAGGQPTSVELPWPRPCPVCGSRLSTKAS